MKRITDRALIALRGMCKTEEVIKIIQDDIIMSEVEEIWADTSIPVTKVFTVDEAILDLARMDTHLLANFPHLMDEEYLRSDAENYEEFLKQKEGV